MLTQRQKEILDFIYSYLKKTGIAPTIQETAQRLRVSSPATIHEHLAALENKGFLIRSKGQARAISLTSNTMDLLPSLYLPNLQTKKQNQAIKKPKVSLINRVIEGDCIEVTKKIPDQSIDFILCDLPYGHTQNSWDSIIPLDKLWAQYERVIKQNGVIALTGQGLFTAKLILSNEKLFKYKITWIKSKPTNFLNAKKQPLRKHEDICIFYNSQPTYHPQMQSGEPYNKGFRKNQLTGSYGNFSSVEVKSEGLRYPNDVVYFKTAESEGKTYHPTQKPVELGRYLIKTFTNPGDTVLDSACGSGSFLVAAAIENRNYIGIEKNEDVYLHKKYPVDYVKISRTRIKEALSQRSAPKFPQKLPL